MERAVAHASKRGATVDKAAGITWGLAVLAAVLIAAISSSCALPDIRVMTPGFNLLPDGTYQGSYDSGMVKAIVDVTISTGTIERIDILKHECGLGKPAEAIVNVIVEAQSLDVDAVAGATYSSLVILKAIEMALTPGI
jgi:uncharacterized protein with FMN-binding domain